jgi:hypothetical protein
MIDILAVSFHFNSNKKNFLIQNFFFFESNLDQKQEKDFLQERTLQLKNRLQDMNREAEYLSQKMAVSYNYLSYTFEKILT